MPSQPTVVEEDLQQESEPDYGNDFEEYKDDEFEEFDEKEVAEVL